MVDDQPRSDAQLLANIKRDLPRRPVPGSMGGGGPRLPLLAPELQGVRQDLTLQIVGALESIAPDNCELDERFRLIVDEGTGKTFDCEHNQRWLDETRPMLEAFWHADYMLRMAVKYGRDLDEAPDVLPSGWAALLCLYGIR